MKIVLGALFATVAVAFGLPVILGGSAAPPAPPVWAYGTDPNMVAHGPEGRADKSSKHLPGSTLEFTDAQIQDHFNPADWYPADHPLMPRIVAQGRQPAVWACA